MFKLFWIRIPRTYVVHAQHLNQLLRLVLFHPQPALISLVQNLVMSRRFSSARMNMKLFAWIRPLQSYCFSTQEIDVEFAIHSRDVYRTNFCAETTRSKFVTIKAIHFKPYVSAPVPYRATRQTIVTTVANAKEPLLPGQSASASIMTNSSCLD